MRVTVFLTIIPMMERNSESPTQEELKEFVNLHVVANQTLLVEHLLHGYDEANEFSLDDIRNRIYENEIQDVFEWWIVTDWLADLLEAKNEPILRNDFGTWWGRTCTGQTIFLDSVIEEIYKDAH